MYCSKACLSVGMRLLLARSAAGSSPTATMPSSLWASRRATSGAILSHRPMTRRLLGAVLPPEPRR